MLALTDQALARLVIAAGAVPVRKRGRWLRHLAAQLEPAPASNGDGAKLGGAAQSAAQRAPGRDGRISNGARRMRAHRSRQAAGRVSLRIECDLNVTSEALFAAGLLSEDEIDDAAAVARAVERVIALLPVRVTRHRHQP